MTTAEQIAKNVIVKHRVLQACRALASKHDFVETNTPAIRVATSFTAPRRRVIVDEPYRAGADAFLKHSHDTALRTMLRYHQRVFEIGQVFRLDDPDRTHYPEFMLCEYAAGGVAFDGFIKLAEELVADLFGHAFLLQRISVRDFIRTNIGIDIATVDSDVLKNAIIGSSPRDYNGFEKRPAFHVVNRYISDKIEPQTGAAILAEYPLCTISKAKRIGDTNTIYRFEMFINGLEVAHSYSYEDSADDFVNRSIENRHHNSEVERTAQMIRAGELPELSGIIGFGVERLCCALTGQPIDDFVFAKEFGMVGETRAM